MGKQKGPVCPGCSRHCPLSHVRCGYGRKYIEKLEKQREDAPTLQRHTRKYKWEKYVRREGPAWALLFAASHMKHVLRKQASTEQQLLSPLNESEQAQLCALLAKLTDAFE